MMFGTMIIASGMPQTIKEKSKVAVYFKEKPFTLKIATVKYTFHLTTDDVNNTEKQLLSTLSDIRKIFVNIGHSIYDIIYLIKNRVTVIFLWR